MHTLKISTISVLCVLCTVATNAFGAGSVRALGGSGTYNGTAAATATTATRTGTATRAGSLRVSPSTTRSVSTATRTNTDGTTTPTERLSIGKYLGGATSVSTTGGSSGGANAADIQQINQQITEIINNADGLADRIDALEASKQDKLTAGDYIIISDDAEVSLDIVELEEYLTENLNLPNKVKIRYVSATDTLEWSEDAGTTWTTLFSLADLIGDYISESDLDDKITALAKYATLDDLALKQDKTDSTATAGNYIAAGTGVGANLNALDTQLKTVSDAIDALDSTYTTGDELTDALALKQNEADSNVATAGNYIASGHGVASNLTALDTQLKTASDAAAAALPASTYNSQVGTVTATNMGTTASTVVTAIKEVSDAIDGLGETQEIISNAPNPGVFVLGVVDGEQTLLPVAPDSQGNY